MSIKMPMNIVEERLRWVLPIRSPNPQKHQTHQPNETPIRVKEEVITLRKKTKLCALKLHWKLKKLELNIPRSTIAKILKDEGLVRKYRVRKITYKYIRAERKPRDMTKTSLEILKI